MSHINLSTVYAIELMPVIEWSLQTDPNYKSAVYELCDEMVGVEVHVKHMLNEALNESEFKGTNYTAVIKCLHPNGGTMNYPISPAQLETLCKV